MGRSPKNVRTRIPIQDNNMNTNWWGQFHWAALQKPTSLRSLHLSWRVYTPEKCRMADHPGHHSPLTHWYHSNNHVNSSQSEAANKKKSTTTVTLRDGPAESNTVVQRFLRSRLIGRLGVSRSLRPCQQRHIRRAHVTTTQILFRTAGLHCTKKFTSKSNHSPVKKCHMPKIGRSPTNGKKCWRKPSETTWISRSGLLLDWSSNASGPLQAKWLWLALKF